jgi:hypothetical protein
MKSNITLNAAIATVLSSKFSSGGSAEVIQREPREFASPVPQRESKSRTILSPYAASELKKAEAKRTRKKIAAASRKRNRK